MNLEIEPYSTQNARWPVEGRVILAQYDDESIVVYQAYSSEIGRFAAENGYFGGAFKLSRMSWIKPNFLWMMYRSGWATKEDQEVVLAVRIKRFAFDELLRLAIHSSFKPQVYETREAWKSQIARSNVRLQWDPDHGPNGEKQDRRAIQLGLSGSVLKKYSRDWIISISDVTEFVREQRHNSVRSRIDQLVIPRERVYEVVDLETIRKLGIQPARQRR